MNDCVGIPYEGKMYNSVRHLAAEKGISASTLQHRINSGMSLDEALGKPTSTPVILFNEIHTTTQEALNKFGTPKARYKNRVMGRNWPKLLAIVAPTNLRLSDFDEFEFDIETMTQAEFDEIVKTILEARRARNPASDNSTTADRSDPPSLMDIAAQKPILTQPWK